MNKLPMSEALNAGQSHWEGCHLHDHRHWNCAVEHIADLTARLAEFETALESWMVVNWIGVYDKERGIRDTVALCIERALDVERNELRARLAEAERERDAALDKALKYDIDACGIELRNQEAVELIELRAEVARLAADAITAQCEWEVRSGVTEARLREAIEKAPHASWQCTTRHWNGTVRCICWKQAALAKSAEGKEEHGGT